MSCASATVVSCSDNDFTQPDNSIVNESNDNISIVNLGDEKSKRLGKMLSFKNIEHFQGTLKELEKDMKINDQYISRTIGKGLKDDDVIEDYFKKYKLDEYSPLIKFENKYNHLSLRKHIWDLETKWLSIQGDDFDSNDPDNHFIIDIYVRTLLNSAAEVMIAGKIYRFYDWGKIVISNKDMEAYYLEYNEKSVSKNPNVEIIKNKFLQTVQQMKDGFKILM